jgi:peptide/nickel transport system ATP-binding protein
MSDAILSIRNLSVSLPKNVDRAFAVEGLSLEVRPKEIVCIVGESGSGKSITAFTTMGLLPKALKPQSGEVLFEGRDLLKTPARDPRQTARRAHGDDFSGTDVGAEPLLYRRRSDRRDV